MLSGFVVEIERLAADAALCRAQLAEVEALVSSYRQRIREGLEPPAPPPESQPAASPGFEPPAALQEMAPGSPTVPAVAEEGDAPTVSPFSVASPEFDPTWGAGGS